jgi:hypothetical protein
MECLIQYLDDLEDLFYAVALKAELLREALQYFLLITASVILQVFTISIALRHPPLALAVASLLMVGMLFHAVVGHPHDVYAS